MKKTLFVLVAVSMVVVLIASCAPKGPSGPSLVNVGGKITVKNSGSNYVLDQAVFDSKSVEMTYNDPWMGDGLKYKGILLRDLISLVKPTSDAATIALIATDGKEFDISIADAQKYDIMLARWVDGNPLDESNGGPVKVAYPDNAKTANGGPYADEQWAWWVVTVTFK